MWWSTETNAESLMPEDYIACGMSCTPHRALLTLLALPATMHPTDAMKSHFNRIYVKMIHEAADAGKMPDPR